ncbi:MAG: hypothetical protein EOP54_08395 [Sphingobacteriales bacterium]|nr:MAG: hypothetical protein EOP54_08395 [Sphingobacteriales bacterium]
MRTIKCILLGLIGITFFISCKKELSSDLPLPSELSPSLFVVNNNNMVLAIDPKTGLKKWEYKVDNNVAATPVVVAGKLVVVDVAGKLYSINRIDGKLDRSVSLGAAVTGTPLVIDDSRLAIAVGNDVKMVNPSDGFNTVWQFGAGVPVMTSPAKNTIGSSDTLQVFFVAGASVFAIRAKDGVLTWRRDVPGAGIFNASVCAANHNYLYAGNDDGKLYAFNSRNGSSFWSYQTGAAIKSSPVSVGGNIMAGSNDRNFYSVDSATGLLRWKVVTGDRVLSSPFVFEQNVYFGSNDFNLYTVNIIDGTLKWKSLAFGTLVTSPLVYDKVAYINSHDKNVYAFDSETGAQKWIYNTNGYMVSSMILDNLTEVVVPSISGNNSF